MNATWNKFSPTYIKDSGIKTYLLNYFLGSKSVKIQLLNKLLNINNSVFKTADYAANASVCLHVHPEIFLFLALFLLEWNIITLNANCICEFKIQKVFNIFYIFVKNVSLSHSLQFDVFLYFHSISQFWKISVHLNKVNLGYNGSKRES